MDIQRSEKTIGIELLVEKGREAFRISENVNYYSEQDYKTAEKKVHQVLRDPAKMLIA